MISQLTHKKQFKTLPLRRKILSEWIFPLTDDFENKPTQRQKNPQDYELNSLALSVTSVQDPQSDIRSSRVQTYPFLSQVSQKIEKSQNSTVSRSRNSSHGAFLHPLSKKNATFYKKRAPSTDVGNINELNITSYRNFKIRSPVKKSKNKISNLQEYMLERDILFQQKSDKQMVKKKISKKKSQEREQLSTISNVKIKWENSYNTLQTSAKIKNQIDEQNSSKLRKNSICPWQSDQNGQFFQ